MSTRRIYIGIFVLSLSLLLFELTLIRVYSVTLFYHFAFMAIAVAMLGLAAAGLTIHLKPEPFRLEKLPKWASMWSGWYAVAVIVMLWIVFRIPVNPYLPPNEVAGKLIFIYLLSAVPFYFAGLVITGLFSAMPDRIGGLYAWDLVGAGVGALMIVPMMNFVGGESTGIYVAMGGAISAVLLSGIRLRKLFLGLLFILIILALINPSVGWLRIHYSKGQSLENLDIKYNRWNSFSRIMAIPFKPGSDAAYTWAPSPNYPLPIMPHFSIMIDDGASTPVLPFDGKNLEPISYLKYDLTSLPHRLNGDGHTMVIGSGGGRDVLTGLMFNAEKIDAVDINPLIFDAMNTSLASFNGRLYSHPKIKQVIAEGRAYARSNPDSYDLLQVAMIDTWAATTAGAYSLSENTLYTVEAFEDYLNALKPDGLLSFTRFFFYPPRQALRLVSLFLETAERMGIEEPENCILVAKFESLATVMFKKKPFSPVEVQKFKDDLKDLGFNLVYAPDERSDRFFASLVGIPDKQMYYDQYPFDVTPSTDDKPFFFNLLKVRDFLRVFEVRGGQLFNYYATLTLMVILILSIVATVVVLVLPLLWAKVTTESFRYEWGLLGYFIGIGLAYIMIEVTLLQRFVLLLEHPAYAASGVVAGLLIFSGLGSMFWNNFNSEVRSKYLLIGFGVVGICLLVHILFGGTIIHSALTLAMGWKVLLAIVLLAPLGIAMGLPLPAGITVAGKQSSSTVAWCWALNGSASVVASPLAVVLAMVNGFNHVLLIGLLCYGLACALMFGVVLTRGGSLSKA